MVGTERVLLMWIAITPEEALDNAIAHSWLRTDSHWKNPGAVIMSQSEDSRKLLKELKSEHIAKIRSDVVRLLVAQPSRTI